MRHRSRLGISAIAAQVDRTRASALASRRCSRRGEPAVASIQRRASLSMPAAARLGVPRRVKDFIDISEYTSLDDLIRYLETIRDNLPAEHEAELKIRGDEVFGRRLTITYFREQTPEEIELETKYSAGERTKRRSTSSAQARRSPLPDGEVR